MNSCHRRPIAGEFRLQDPPRPLPEIAIADGNGKAGSLADFRGKFVLLNIWATWCALPQGDADARSAARPARRPRFQVVALSIDRGGADVVRKFYADIGVQDIAIHLDSAEAPFSARRRWPANHVLIDREGPKSAA